MLKGWLNTGLFYGGN